MGRRLRLRLDLLQPSLATNVEHSHAKQKLHYDTNKPHRQFREGESVYARDFTSATEKWIPGIVEKVTGPLSYVIKLIDESTIRRHVDHIKAKEARENKDKLTVNTNENEYSDSSWDTINVNPINEEQSNVLPTTNTTQTIEPALRRTQRNRQPVFHYPGKTS